MSSSGTISNYYVDSLIGHESEEVYGSRFVQGGHSGTSRPSGVAESSDFSSCSFAPKSTVFSTSWSTVHPQPSAAMTGIYHPYMHQPHLGAADAGRYVRSWIEPFPGFPGGGGCSSSRESQGIGVPEYTCSSFLQEPREKAAAGSPGPPPPAATTPARAAILRRRNSSNLTQITLQQTGSTLVQRGKSVVPTQSIKLWNWKKNFSLTCT
ncbi:homeobox D9 [Columba livia]|uniref:Homeobox D9 n=1 Tax=Columba livia TaxID=8932 RepID=A0A2I0MIJ7_COLLI|nr:homeobox D9 [Columba livia]